MILVYKNYKVDIPFEALSIDKIKIESSLNNHASLYIKLLTVEGKIQEYINRSMENEKVVVYKDNNEKVFVGKIKKFQMSFESGVEMMELNCISYTNDFDIKKNSRTFTNLNMTYNQMINKVLQNYPKKSFIDNVTNGKEIGDFVLQYEETDWEFIKRIATHFNAVILPEVTEDYGRFNFGLPTIGSNKEIKSDEYKVVKNINDYNKHEALGMEDNFLQEYTKWDIVCKEEFKLGEQVTFNDVSCVVSKIRIETYKEEIRTIYTLALARGVRTGYKINHKIFGMSIPATVKEVQGNNMKVNFSIENNAGGNEKFFTFAIESSSFYCMPEVGSEVHVYFPTNDEKDAIAVHAIRKTGSGAKYASKTSNPDVKSFSHTAGSNMELSPSNMNFASDAGGASTVNLSESGDVEINASNITLTATEDAQLGMRESSGDEPPFRPTTIDISAKDSVTISKGGTKVEVVDNINVGGPIIKYDGKIKDAVEVPADVAKWQSADMQAQIDQINAGAEQYEIQKIEEAKSKVFDGIFTAVVGAAAVVAGAAIIAGATILTGGLALAAGSAFIACGIAGATIGTSQISEGMSDYSKVQGGDFSKSYNFVRDSLLGGNQALYDGIKYTVTVINGFAVAFVTGGGTAAAASKAGVGFLKGGTIAGLSTLASDYLDDGKINMPPSAYLDSITKGGTLGSIAEANRPVKPKQKTSLKDKVKNKVKEKKEKVKNAYNSAKNTLKNAKNTAKNAAHKLKEKSKNIYNYLKEKKADPIDAVDGSLYIPAVDIQLPDIHNEFLIERKYESTNYETGVFGFGWTSNFESYIEEYDDYIEVSCSDGHVEKFNIVDGEYINTKNGAKLYTLNKVKDIWIFKSYSEEKTYKYNELGKLINVIDRYGNTLTITYIDKNIETITTFSNYKLFFTCKDNKVIQIKDELGRTVQYKYDGDYLTEVVHVDQGITRYNYDDNGYISYVTDQNGQTYIKNFFDKEGRVIRQEYPDGDFVEISYDEGERENTFYYHNSGRVEKVRYNEDALITKSIYEDGSTKEYGYDEYQNRNYEKDRNGNITRREFNIYGSLLKEELPNGLIKEFIYDEDQNLIKEFDNEGKEVLYTYDKTGNLLEEKTKISVGKWKTEKFTYDSFGRVLTKTDANNNTIKYEYAIGDSLNEKIGKDPVKVVTGSGYVYEYSYDNVGRNTEIKTDYGTIEFGYNNLDYVAKIKDANGNITKKSYDKMGNLIRVDTPNGIVKDIAEGEGYHYEYDHMDRLISIKNPLGYVQRSIRDSEGNIIKEVNPNYYDSSTKDGKGIEFVYDKDNRKIKTIYPDGGVERLFYDPNGNVIRHISPEYYNEETDDGLGYSYTYDSLNRLKEVINEEGIIEKTFEYDHHGNIIKETEVDGTSTLYKYDLLGNVIEKKVPVELENVDNANDAKYAYDVNDANNAFDAFDVKEYKNISANTKYNVTYYEYDNNGNKVLEKHGINLVSEDEVCLKCNEINFKYDSENRLIEVSDKYGAKARYKYDCLNHKTYESFKINDDTTKVIHYIYDKVGNLIERKEELSSRFISPDKRNSTVWSSTKYEYDKNGNIIKITTPNGYEIGRVYDEIDRVIEEYQVDDVNGIFRAKVYEYDKADNIIALREFSGSDAKEITKKYLGEYNYNLKFFDRYNKKKENEKLFAEKNFNFDKKKKEYKYDEQNRLTHFVNASGNTTRLFYDKNDRIIKQVLPEQYDINSDDGVGTTYKYNPKGQVVEVINGLGEIVTQNTYDPKGNLKSTIDGEKNKVEYTYTLLGQIKDITTPNSRKENKKAQSYSYDARGNITGVIDGNGNETSYVLDDWGRIIQINTPEGGVEKYTYDYAGNITSTTDANGGTIEYIYNSLRQVSEIKDQEGNSEYFYYDKEGNLTKRIDRNGNHQDRSYNIDKNIVSLEAYKLNKEDLEKNKLNVVRQKLKYNPDGTLSNANFNNMYYNYEYNVEGLLEKKSTSGKTLLEYTYDKNNNIKSIKDITGKSSIYTYDKANRLKTIQDENNNIQAQYEYYGNDNIKSVTLGNGVKTDYTYDGDGNVESLVTVTLSGEVLVDYSYAYDLNGNRLQKVSSKHKNYYSYDSMNRLVDSSYDGRKESFTYDKVGNRLTKTTNDITEKYVYNVKNQLKEVYQEKGNSTHLRSLSKFDLAKYKIWSLTYDKQGNTLKEDTNSGTNSFEYNALNQQVKAITKDGNTLVNRYDAEGLRYEVEENDKLSKFIFHNDEVLVETDETDDIVSRFIRGYDIVAADVKDGRYYYSVDEQGSTEFITDVTGKVRNEYRYDAFGNVLEAKEDIHNRITYTGQQFDNVTQQYYLRARFYNPLLSRFTQEDEYRGDGLNLYAYCENNPVVYYDPSGYMCSKKINQYNKKRAKEKNSGKKLISPLNSKQQKKYNDARKRGIGAAESYYIATGKNPLDTIGSKYMVKREEDKIINYYQNATRKYYKNRKGTGSAHKVGSWTHGDVASDMNNNFIPKNKKYLPYIEDIQIEQNYLNGRMINNNAKGSSRVDMLISNKVNKNIVVADIKTGRARYRGKQKRKNENNINGFNSRNRYTFTHIEIKP
ncbi:RHS repeat-associated core domain-containing protein [uncultured Clostridium sp.]|uniref:RHS repeat-associated core domain-containing protein n=1 Tax=uncultured Clostridium sp. TaxID=59620 RepID=UPI0025D81915|nr:RHS repeat-associated core domain-containing protein [uncultured Clostridium sp.]